MISATKNSVSKRYENINPMDNSAVGIAMGVTNAVKKVFNGDENCVKFGYKMDGESCSRLVLLLDDNLVFNGECPSRLGATAVSLIDGIAVLSYTPSLEHIRQTNFANLTVKAEDEPKMLELLKEMESCNRLKNVQFV